MSDLRFATDHQIWRGVAKLAAIGLAAGIALLVVSRLAGAHPSVGLCLGLPTAAGALMQLLMLTLTENLPVEAAHAEPIDTTPGPIIRLRQLERRLQAASIDGSKFDWNVRPVLLELVDDKLRHKYAVNLWAQPEQARAILGEKLWLDLNSQQSAPSSGLSLVRLTAMVAAIEAI